MLVSRGTALWVMSVLAVVATTAMHVGATQIFYESFEDPVIDGSVTNVPTGWSVSGSLDRNLMSDGAITGKTGDQSTMLFSGNDRVLTTTSSILASNLTAGVRYTLTCDVTVNDDRSNPMGIISLIAGSTVISATTDLILQKNNFTGSTFTNTFVALSDDTNIGQPLAISLARKDGWGNSYAYFDNLTLDAADTSGDMDPPTPTNMVWDGLPTSSVGNSITMQVTNAVDINLVQFFFTNTVNGNVSGWQDSPLWTDGDLTPGMTYSYKVKARDKSSNTNETNWSSEESAKCEEHIILYESFEEPSILPHTYLTLETVAPEGWVGGGASTRAVMHELSSEWPADTPFGAQWAGMRGGTYIETTSAISNHVLQAGYIYRVTYNTGCTGNRVGEENGVPGTNTVQIIAGTNVVASSSLLTSLDDFSETNVVEFIPDAAHADLGESLKLKLWSDWTGNWWYHVTFDNIKVYAIPPPPAGMVLIIR